MKKNPLHKIRTVITVVLATVAFVVAIIGVLVTVPKNGSFKMLVVQTGSMEPNIPVGSLIISKKAASYQVGDVVTYAMKNNFVTHRIVTKENSNYITQGDANNAPDGNPVSPSSIIGKLWISLPFVGRFIAFVKTPPGFTLIIILPSLLIVINEILVIGKELSKTEQKKKAKTKKVIASRRVASVDGIKKMPSPRRTAKSAGVVMVWTRSGKKESREKIATKKRISQAIAMLLITIVSLIGGTKAYFSDLGLSTNNMFNAGQYIATGMVINELMYTSSPSCAEQVIELWNGSSGQIDLKKWRLRQGSNVFTIEGNPNLLNPGGFALIAKSVNSFHNCYGQEPSGVQILNVQSHPDLNTTSGTLELLMPTGTTVIDRVDYGGSNPTAAMDKSIERRQVGFDTAGDGTFVAGDFISQFPATFGFGLPSSQTVVINEFMVQPDSGSPQEFIELRNNSGSNVNISGWQIFSGNGTGAPNLRATVPASTTLNAGQRYLHQYAATANELPNTNEKIFLKDTAGVIRDAFAYGMFIPPSGTSWSRIPEGTNTWVLDSSETPGTANIL